MPRLRWSQSVSDDAEVAVVRCETEDQGETLGRTSYDIRATFTDSISDETRFVSPGDAVVENVEWLSEDSATDLMATVTVPKATTVERVVGYWDTTRTPLYLPSKSFLKSVEAASNGNRGAVRTVLDAFDTPVQVPVICGAFLDHQSVIDLVETVTSVDRHAASVIHSYRYPILRGALVSRTGLCVNSAAELELLADGFDSMEAIGDVDHLDCLADVMATAHGSIEETERLLDTLGYELSELETEADGQFFAYYLAHVVLCDGFTTAVEHTRQRRRHLNEDYEQLKQEARNAPYRRRGETWRRLLSPAARMTMGEFAYVLANALYWTGEVSRSDSRVSELKQVQDAPTTDWPVFPTAHRPSMYAVAREELGDRFEQRLEAVSGDIWELLRAHRLTPPSLTTAGARSLMRRLTEEADIDVEEGYLQLHGGRRGLGDLLYRQDRGHAQDILRHDDLSTTQAAYQHIDAEERRHQLDGYLEDADE